MRAGEAHGEREVGEGGRMRVVAVVRNEEGEDSGEEVVDVEEISQDGQSIQNMLSSLVYSLGLNEIETKQIISLWHNRTVIPPLDPAHLSYELARRKQIFREEHSNFLLQSSAARLREDQVRKN